MPWAFSTSFLLVETPPWMWGLSSSSILPAVSQTPALTQEPPAATVLPPLEQPFPGSSIPLPSVFPFLSFSTNDF